MDRSVEDGLSWSLVAQRIAHPWPFLGLVLLLLTSIRDCIQ